MSASEHISIAMGADENFALPLAMTLYSAARALGKDKKIDAYIVDGGLSPKSIRKIARIIALTKADFRLNYVTGDVARLKSYGLPLGRFGLMAYLRLLLPEILPPNLDQVIYLDSDLIICDCLSGLWAYRSDTHPVSGVPDYACPLVSSEGVLPNWRELGLSGQTPYINSGVLLLNLQLWRSDDLAQRIFDYIRQYKHIIQFPDQDGINAVLAASSQCVPWRWHVPAFLDFANHYHRIKVPLSSDPEFTGYPQYLKKAGIIHFVGPRKPWMRGLAGGYSQTAWLRNCRRSGWFSLPGYWKFAAPIEIDRAFRTLYRRVRGQ